VAHTALAYRCAVKKRFVSSFVSFTAEAVCSCQSHCLGTSASLSVSLRLFDPIGLVYAIETDNNYLACSASVCLSVTGCTVT